MENIIDKLNQIEDADVDAIKLEINGV